MLKKLLLIILIGSFYHAGYALDSDMEQPATLDADDFEMDFNTGVRIYRGNVEFRQGSLRLNCDELTTYLNGNDQLDKAICIGSPGKFRQRPEGQNEDVIGTAGEITMDQINDLITLKNRAKVVQGGSTITGKTIAYDMSTEKVKVKGGGSQGTKTTTQSASSGGVSEESSGSESVALQVDNSENARPSLVIQPRKKKGAVPESEAETEIISEVE